MGQPEPQTAASVWSAIRYLDSPTDYREHLPRKARSAPPQENELVLLDTSAHGLARLRNLTLIVLLVCLVLLLLLWS
jgi:hypothetical protein